MADISKEQKERESQIGEGILKEARDAIGQHELQPANVAVLEDVESRIFVKLERNVIAKIFKDSLPHGDALVPPFAVAPAKIPNLIFTVPPSKKHETLRFYTECEDKKKQLVFINFFALDLNGKTVSRADLQVKYKMDVLITIARSAHEVQSVVPQIIETGNNFPVRITYGQHPDKTAIPGPLLWLCLGVQLKQLQPDEQRELNEKMLQYVLTNNQKVKDEMKSRGILDFNVIPVAMTIP